MFMGNNSNTFPYRRQYVSAFDVKNTIPYDAGMNLIDILKAALERRDWGPYQLAEASGVPQPTIQRIMSGKHADPRRSTVRKLAEALGCTEGQLWGLEPWPELSGGQVREDAPVYLSARERALIENLRHCAEEDARAVERMALLSASEAQRKDESV